MSGSYVTLLDTMLLVLLICALRFVLRTAPRRIRCLLWAAIPLRLLVPFVVPSIFSLYQLSDVAHDMIFPPVSAHVTLNAVPAETGPSIDIFPIIALCGSLLILIIGCVQMLRLKRSLREAVPVKDNVWACDNVHSPFIYGMIRPRIYVPADLGNEELSDVLAHEQEHLDHKDHWWKPLAFMILAWRWYDPFMWLAFWLFARDLEDRCDEAVIAPMQQQQRGHYARSLLTCSDACGAIRGPLAFGEVNVKERIKRIMSYRCPPRWVTCLGAIALCAAAVCLLTVPDYSSRAGVIDRFERITPQDSRFSTAELDDAMNVAAAEFHKYFDGCTLRSLTYDEAFSTSYLDGSSDDPQRTIVLTAVFDVCEAGNAAKTLNNGTTYVDYPWILTQDEQGHWHSEGYGYC